MADFLNNPALEPVIGAAIMTLLLLWPVARIFRRNGQSPWLTLLLLFGIPFPFMGFILTGAAFIMKRKPVMDNAA